MHHAQLLLQYVLAFVSQLGNYIPRSELAEEFIMIVGKLTGLERRIETLEASGRRDAQTRNEVSEIKKLVRDLTAEWSNLRERNTSLERQFRDKMSTIPPPQCREDVKLHKDMPWQQAIHSYNGELLWKIEGYQRKRQDAIKRVKTALYSPPFYTAQFGYKMCAKIYMNGDGSGKGSHLSLFFVVMRGELVTYVFGDLGLSPTQRRVCYHKLEYSAPPLCHCLSKYYYAYEYLQKYHILMLTNFKKCNIFPSFETFGRESNSIYMQ